MIIDDGQVAWDSITREQLKHLIVDNGLTTSAVAQMFNVTASKVQYKKSKLKLTGAALMYEHFKNKEIFETGRLNRSISL